MPCSTTCTPFPSFSQLQYLVSQAYRPSQPRLRGMRLPVTYLGNSLQYRQVVQVVRVGQMDLLNLRRSSLCLTSSVPVALPGTDLLRHPHPSRSRHDQAVVCEAVDGFVQQNTQLQRRGTRLASSSHLTRTAPLCDGRKCLLPALPGSTGGSSSSQPLFRGGHSHLHCHRPDTDCELAVPGIPPLSFV